jgi:hypothetical protein
VNATTFRALREVTRRESLSLRVRGACMAPAFEDGGTVRVRARRFYFPGDVLVFRTNAGDLAAHRMLGWRRAALVTKGDDCEVHDAPVTRQEILGAVDVPVRVIDRLRALASFAKIALRRLAR